MHVQRSSLNLLVWENVLRKGVKVMFWEIALREYVKRGCDEPNCLKLDATIPVSIFQGEVPRAGRCRAQYFAGQRQGSLASMYIWAWFMKCTVLWRNIKPWCCFFCDRFGCQIMSSSFQMMSDIVPYITSVLTMVLNQLAFVRGCFKRRFRGSDLRECFKGMV